MNRQPIEGTYKIKESFAHLFSKKHMDYNYQIFDSKVKEKYTSVFVTPVKKDGSETTFHTAANLGQWANMKCLEKVD